MFVELVDLPCNFEVHSVSQTSDAYNSWTPCTETEEENTCDKLSIVFF
jgi:hypothetical protein